MSQKYSVSDACAARGQKDPAAVGMEQAPKSTISLLTFSEAKNVPGQFVYGLHDRSGLFYVGKTTNAAQRFYQHRSDQVNPRLWRRVKAAGDSLRIEIIAHNPPDLSAAEGDAIALNAARLVNIMRNPFRFPSRMHVPLAASRDAVADCPGCGNPLDKPGCKLCRLCTSKLSSTVGSSKAELRAMLAELAPRAPK